MGRALQTIVIYVLIAFFLIGGGMFFYYYMSGDLNEPIELEEDEIQASNDPIINDTNSTATAGTLVKSLTWKQKTVRKVLSYMGFEPGDDAEKESQAVFMATKNIILFVIFTFGSILLAISAVIYISKMRSKGDEF